MKLNFTREFEGVALSRKKEAYWALTSSVLLEGLMAQAGGLRMLEAHDRLKRFGKNIIHSEERLTRAYV